MYPTIPHILRLAPLHLLTLLLGPALTHAFLAFIIDQGSGWNVVAHRACRGHVDIIGKSDRRDQRCIAAHLDTIADFRFVFVESVVVARNRAGADVGILADGSIAKIGEMVGLGSGPELRLLGLDEIADVNMGTQFRARPEVREGSDDRTVVNAAA